MTVGTIKREISGPGVVGRARARVCVCNINAIIIFHCTVTGASRRAGDTII